MTQEAFSVVLSIEWSTGLLLLSSYVSPCAHPDPGLGLLH